MNLNSRIWRVNKHGLQVLYVLLDALRLVPVGPVHSNVVGMTFAQPIPFLVRKNVKVERVKRGELLVSNLLRGLVLFEFRIRCCATTD